MTKQRPILLFFPGSFNPPTRGHLRLLDVAKDILTARGLSVVGGIVSPVHDDFAVRKPTLIDASHRFKMVEAAITDPGYGWLTVSGIEVSESTWITTKTSLERHQTLLDAFCDGEEQKPEWINDVQVSNEADHPRLMLVVGADVFESLPNPEVWSADEVTTILRDFGVVVVSRNGIDVEKIVHKNSNLRTHLTNIHVVRDMVGNPISSTAVRNEIRAGYSLRQLIPYRVIQYIRDNSLYNIPQDEYQILESIDHKIPDLKILCKEFSDGESQTSISTESRDSQVVRIDTFEMTTQTSTLTTETSEMMTQTLVCDLTESETQTLSTTQKEIETQTQGSSYVQTENETQTLDFTNAQTENETQTQTLQSEQTENETQTNALHQTETETQTKTPEQNQSSTQTPKANENAEISTQTKASKLNDGITQTKTSKLNDGITQTKTSKLNDGETQTSNVSQVDEAPVKIILEKPIEDKQFVIVDDHDVCCKYLSDDVCGCEDVSGGEDSKVDDNECSFSCSSECSSCSCLDPSTNLESQFSQNAAEIAGNATEPICEVCSEQPEVVDEKDDTKPTLIEISTEKNSEDKVHVEDLKDISTSEIVSKESKRSRSRHHGDKSEKTSSAPAVQFEITSKGVRVISEKESFL